ncbi:MULTISPECIES: response regulator transcription factor [unclassified Carboxylicivirga]|uniref:helix-turn-helix transcriptional regulator n=1 Tax=Carboxylicivirga TaxID=1628153 RepID=UPI003D357FDF
MIKVLIAEQSHVIGVGLIELIKKFQDISGVKMIGRDEDCCDIVKDFDPDLLMINTNYLDPEKMHSLVEAKRNEAVLIYVFNSFLPLDAPDNHLSIVDTKASIHSKLQAAMVKVKRGSKENDTEELSPRERSILKGVALGLTNKEIADKTYISIHTVISHRKNITRKLGIKTVSGLTVYAILNNIIQMDDIT